jgi:Dehydrogenases with different specificities (related to short-chain alcohol dehydrogenases)
MPLKGRAAVVTGAGRGIGAAIAMMLAMDGADVVLMDLSLERIKGIEDKINQAGGHAISMTVDVSSSEDVTSAVDSIITRFKKIDILVNNAGVAYSTPFEELSEQEWDKVIDINLKGAFLCAQSVIGRMREQMYGRIINISSMAGVMGSENAGAHYCASKAGIIGLTKYLSKSYARFGITVNAVAPGPVETDMTVGFGEEGFRTLKESMPMKKIGRPEDIACIAAFLASVEAGFITGTVIEASGGQIIV